MQWIYSDARGPSVPPALTTQHPYIRAAEITGGVQTLTSAFTNPFHQVSFLGSPWKGFCAGCFPTKPYFGVFARFVIDPCRFSPNLASLTLEQLYGNHALKRPRVRGRFPLAFVCNTNMKGGCGRDPPWESPSYSKKIWGRAGSFNWVPFSRVPGANWASRWLSEA